MAKSTDSGATAPEQTKVGLVKEAQAEQQTVITGGRLELIESLMVHKSIGGDDQIEESLLEILSKHPKGISYSLLQAVFPDAGLMIARELLKKEGKIEQVGKKGKVILKPVAAK